MDRIDKLPDEGSGPPKTEPSASSLGFWVPSAIYAILNALPSQVFELTAEHHLVWWNKAAQTTAHYEQGPIARQPALRGKIEEIFEALRQCGEVPQTVPNAIPSDAKEQITVIPLSNVRASGCSVRMDQAYLIFIPNDREASRDRNPDVPTPSLTLIERKLVERIATGRTVRAAAAEIGIPFHTARKYIQRIYRKTGVNKQGALAHYWASTTASTAASGAPR